MELPAPPYPYLPSIAALDQHRVDRLAPDGSATHAPHPGHTGPGPCPLDHNQHTGHTGLTSHTGQSSRRLAACARSAAASGLANHLRRPWHPSDRSERRRHPPTRLYRSDHDTTRPARAPRSRSDRLACSDWRGKSGRPQQRALRATGACGHGRAGRPRAAELPGHQPVDRRRQGKGGQSSEFG